MCSCAHNIFSGTQKCRLLRTWSRYIDEQERDEVSLKVLRINPTFSVALRNVAMPAWLRYQSSTAVVPMWSSVFTQTMHWYIVRSHNKLDNPERFRTFKIKMPNEGRKNFSAVLRRGGCRLRQAFTMAMLVFQHAVGWMSQPSRHCRKVCRVGDELAVELNTVIRRTSWRENKRP